MNGDATATSRKYINIREKTYDDLDKLRLEVEPGRKESWDQFFRRTKERMER